MRLKNLIKCHLSYLLSKGSIIILVIMVILLVVVYISNSYIDDYISLKEAVDSYYLSSLTITKVIFCNVACFIMANFFSIKNDAYLSLLITRDVKKTYYFYTKILCVFFILFFIIFILCLLYLFVGFILIKGFVFEKRFILSFLYIYLISVVYSLYTNILVVAINNIFVFLIPAILSILVQSLAQGSISGFEKGLFLFFPVVNNSLSESFFGIYLIISLLIILLIVDIFVYRNKDYRTE